ncbi:MAG: hypothetical protein KAS62_02900 [Candidatus Delongbacteria bacterium]|nr:hypothetical protein [Candidatus Delongbacteria bacterium]
MKRLYIITMLIVFLSLSAETLFEIKDSSDQAVFSISDDGLRVFNLGDTLMVISATEIKAFIASSKDRALSRSFSVTTSTTGKGTGDVVNIDPDGLRVYNNNDKLMDITASNITAYIDSNSTKALSRSFSVTTSTTGKESVDVMEVSTNATKLREGEAGDHYTDFSPNNIFLGLNAGVATTAGVPDWDDGYGNVFVGNDAGLNNVLGTYNVFLGRQAGYSNTNELNNTHIGNSAGFLANGFSNTYVGSGTGRNSNGSNNSFFGAYAGWFGSGGGNSLFGNGTGYNIGGSSNIVMGNSAGRGITGSTYSYNCILGHSAGYSLDTGSNNVLLGYRSGYSNVVGTGNVFLGYQTGYSETGSNKLYIDNSDTSTPLIYGDFGTDMLTLNGNVGIGVAPNSDNKLTIENDSYSGISCHAHTSAQGYVNGVYGRGDDGTTRNVGIFGYSTGGSGTNWAGYFFGDINVTGTVVKSVSKTTIDHPLDPTNKFLTHAAVESDNMMNIYNGNVILDNNGRAVVTMPDWFESLNTEFRYQLTPMGASAPELYLAKEISNESFEIAGGKPNMKVSWQVTGIRNDEFAKANPIEVETSKDQIEKGYYLHPKAYGQPEEMGIEFQHQKRMEEQSEK